MNAPELADLDRGYAEPFARFLLGRADAIACVSKLFQIAHVLDDLIDRDRPATDDEIVATFWLALIDVPQDPFFSAHATTLRPIMASAMLNWMAANTMERAGEPADLKIAFVLRSAYVDLLSMAALIVGGLAWAAEIIPEIRRWVHAEGFDGYLLNLVAEKEARDVR